MNAAIPEESLVLLKPTGVVAITGEFDLTAIREFLAEQGGVKGSYRAVEVWQGKGADNVMIAVVSPQILAFGDKVSIRRAVSQYATGDGSQLGSSIYQHAAALAQANDFWIAGEIPPNALKGAASSGIPAALANSLVSFDIGVRARGNVEMDVNLYTKSPEDAESMASTLQAMLQLAAAGQSDPLASALLSQLEMGTYGDWVHIGAFWSEQQVAELSRQRLDPNAPPALPATGASPRVNIRTPAAAAQPAAPVQPAGPPKPLKVRIYNPDGGVKDIELTRD